MNFSEKELIEKLKVDDLEAFHQIFERNYRPLVKYARRFVMDINTAEDITQQTFLYTREKRSVINIDRSLNSYLFRAVQNACINFLNCESRMEEYTKSFIMETYGQFNETLEQVVNAIKLSSPLDYEIEERIVTLRLDPVFKNDN